MVKTKRDIARARKFDVCFDLTIGIDIDADDFKIYINCPIVDGPVLPDMDVLMSMAELGHLLAYKKKLKVLVHCNQGINRSSLLVGSILHIKGMKGKKIVKCIRQKRKGALTNPYFEKYLCSLV